MHDPRAFTPEVIHHRQDDHGEGLAGGAEKHELAATEFLDGEDGDPGGEEIFGAVGGGEDAGCVGREVDAVLVDGGGVVGDEVDAADLWLD